MGSVVRGWWSRVGGPGSVALVGSGVRAGGLEVRAQRAPRLQVINDLSGPEPCSNCIDEM